MWQAAGGIGGREGSGGGFDGGVGGTLGHGGLSGGGDGGGGLSKLVAVVGGEDGVQLIGMHV